MKEIIPTNVAFLMRDLGTKALLNTDVIGYKNFKANRENVKKLDQLEKLIKKMIGGTDEL